MKTVRLVKIRTADLILLSAFILLFFSANVLAQTSSPEGNQPVLIPLKDIADVIKHLTVPGQGRIEELVFSPDARYLAMGSGNSILLWDLTSGEFKSLSVPVKFSTFYSECSFSPDGKTLASVISREKLVLWDLTTGSNRVLETDTAIFSVAYSPDGKLLATGSNSTGISIWDAGSGKRIKNFLKKKDDSYSGITFTPDGKYVLAKYESQNIVMVEVSTGNVVRSFSGHKDYVNALAISRDGKFLISGSSGGSIIIFDLATGEKLKDMTSLSGGVNDVAISPESKLIAAAIGESLPPWEKAKAATSVLLIDLEGGQNRNMNIPFCYAVAFSPNGEYLATGLSGGQELVTLWDVSNYGIKNKFNKDPFETTQEFEARVGTIEIPYSYPIILQAGQYNADKGGFEAEFKINKIFIQVERDKAKELANRKIGELKLKGIIKYHNPENLKLTEVQLADTVTGQSYPVIKTGEVAPPEKKSGNE
jgi:WD40 repeat protein